MVAISPRDPERKKALGKTERPCMSPLMQVHKDFNLNSAAGILGYLADLGLSHVTSPLPAGGPRKH
jgi:hypothetical protein